MIAKLSFMKFLNNCFESSPFLHALSNHLGPLVVNKYKFIQYILLHKIVLDDITVCKIWTSEEQNEL